MEVNIERKSYEDANFEIFQFKHTCERGMNKDEYESFKFKSAVVLFRDFSVKQKSWNWMMWLDGEVG